jgi:phospholipid/cholesterol/gamma-HCH transport system substrate-binding protein
MERSMRLQYSSMEKLTGAFILLTLLILLFTVAVVGRGKNWFRKHVTYYTTFKEGYNLVTGSRVKLFGTDIGSVTDVELTENNLVRMRIRVLAAYASRIRIDSIASVESPTFIGSEYIALTPGSTDAPVIPPGGNIISKEKKKFTEYLEEYEFERTLKLVRDILENLVTITTQLQESTGPLFGTLENIRQLSTTVNEGEGTLGLIIKSDELYQNIMSELDSIGKLVASLRKTVDHFSQAGADFEKTAKNVEEFTHGASEMTDKIQELLERLLRVSVLLERAMTDVPEISRQAREGMREVNRILDSVKENFLIRPNLPPAAAPESHGLEIRGDQ